MVPCGVMYLLLLLCFTAASTAVIPQALTTITEALDVIPEALARAHFGALEKHGAFESLVNATMRMTS